MKFCSEIIFAAASLMPHRMISMDKKTSFHSMEGTSLRDVKNTVGSVECEEGAARVLHVNCHGISKLSNIFFFSADECKVQVIFRPLLQGPF